MQVDGKGNETDEKGERQIREGDIDRVWKGRETDGWMNEWAFNYLTGQ